MATALLMPLPQVKNAFNVYALGRSTEQLIYEMSQIFAVFQTSYANPPTIPQS